MSIFKKKKSNLEREIERVLKIMEERTPSTEDYTHMVNNLETLCSANEKNKKNKLALLGTGLTVFGSLAGIVAIIYSEETRIITSKALGLLIKGRV